MPGSMSQDTSVHLGGAKPVEWMGTSRYEVLTQLGRGGMGVVYEAFDRDRRHFVALKTLLNFDPTALYRFKQEFRSIAGVVHTNLVQLYELVVPEDGKAFFTMELVRGPDFLRYVGVRSPPSSRAPAQAVVTVRRVGANRPTSPPHTSSGEHEAVERKRMAADEDRLRDALRQLVRAVNAVHTAGKVHRDIKPPNVLVTPEGRVVLLDFGVAIQLAGRGCRAAAEGENEMVGTAAYMAPEQALGEPTSAASDWYSVGVMLYEALVGQPPW